jgi:hypothetical protein
VFCSQKVFVSERWILAYGHAIGIELRTGKNLHIEMLYFHRPSKCSLQMGSQVSMHTVCASKQRYPSLQDGYQNHDSQQGFPPFTQRHHHPEVSQSSLKKCMASLPKYVRRQLA